MITIAVEAMNLTRAMVEKLLVVGERPFLWLPSLFAGVN